MRAEEQHRAFWLLGQHEIADANSRMYLDAILVIWEAVKFHTYIETGGKDTGTCWICDEPGHSVDGCRSNPVVLAAVGNAAIYGMAFRCFHCGVLFTSHATALRHFGMEVVEPPECAMDGFTEVQTAQITRAVELFGRLPLPDSTTDRATFSELQWLVNRWKEQHVNPGQADAGSEARVDRTSDHADRPAPSYR